MKNVQTILCTVLGKPDSHLAVNKAINLALEHDAKLIFATVLNAEFIGKATPVMASFRVVIDQLHELGSFTLSLLCDQALKRGVKEVESIIKEGKMIPQLRALISEVHPEILVLGRPIARGRPVFSVKPDQIDDFLSEIRSLQKVHVEVIDTNNTEFED